MERRSRADLGALLAILLVIAALYLGRPLLMPLALALLGAYYACTDGVLMAAVSAWMPADLRASGFAMITTATGLSRLVGSALFGVLWQTWSLQVAVAVFAAALTLALLLTARTWIRLETLP